MTFLNTKTLIGYSLVEIPKQLRVVKLRLNTIKLATWSFHQLSYSSLSSTIILFRSCRAYNSHVLYSIFGIQSGKVRFVGLAMTHSPAERIIVCVLRFRGFQQNRTCFLSKGSVDFCEAEIYPVSPGAFTATSSCHLRESATQKQKIEFLLPTNDSYSILPVFTIITKSYALKLI